MGAEVIQLRGLRLSCVCGALPEEQERRQPYEFDIDVSADLSAACRSDDLVDTLDYGAVLDAIETVTRDESFQLFEAMAERVAAAVLADPRASQVTVEVRKLRPPVTQDLASSGIRITRVR